MVLDYSGRRPVPKNDYSGRRPVPKNRPRKQPVGIFVAILIIAISMSFGLGVLTGWLVFKPSSKAAQAQEACAAAANNAQPSAAQAPYQNPEAGPAKAGEPPLTFFETLPKGGKAVIGSGLNPRKAGEPQPATPPASPKPEVRKTEAKAPPTEQGQKPEKGEAPAPQKEAAGKFCVQTASTQERSDAES